MPNRKSILLFAFILCLALALLPASPAARAQSTQNDTITPIDPFRIAYNLFYVGSRELAAYLIVTPEGNILINSNLALSVPQIQQSIEKLGYKLTDTKILLISQASADHASGSAEILRLTHAKYMVMDGDVDLVQDGGRKGLESFEPARVDRILHDRDTVSLGGFDLLAYKTAGNTPGTTSWTMQAMNNGELNNVVILGGLTVSPGTRLIDLPRHPSAYPGVALDYKKSFRLLASLPATIFLSANASDFNMLKKLDKIHKNPGVDEAVWVDPSGYQSCISASRRAFQRELNLQQKPQPQPPAKADFRP